MGRQIKLLFLPGEGPPVWKLCNYGMRFPNTVSNKMCMCRGFADEAVVAVKPGACEDMVTYQRIKLSERNRDVKGEGWNMLLRVRNP